MIRSMEFIHAKTNDSSPKTKSQTIEWNIDPEVLVLPSVGRAGRTPLVYDSLHELITGSGWKVPKKGDKIKDLMGNDKVWESISLPKDNNIKHPHLRGGYALVRVQAKSAGVIYLQAQGHLYVYANGELRTGDFYNRGHIKVPIRLQQGENILIFRGLRGEVRFQFSQAPSHLDFLSGDETIPDLVVGEQIDTFGAVVVANPTSKWAENIKIVTKKDKKIVGTKLTQALPPFSIRKIPFAIQLDPITQKGKLHFNLEIEADGKLVERGIDLECLDPKETRRETFFSSIDGSLQYYAVVPPLSENPQKKSKLFSEAKPAKGDKKDKLALVLTLHGASVEGIGQARSYQAKKDTIIVAPTNRRPFGFDWEDWGRWDAIEVLEIAKKKYPIDPQKVYLTGHSMGGHGTWHLGVTFPDRFAAIGPSAGWVSMWSYAGAAKKNNNNRMLQLLFRAMNASDTMALSKNYQTEGVYVLHGDADDNVPVAQARMMRKLLQEFHKDFAYHEEHGVGHWWGKEGISGAACVDWPLMFHFFARHKLPLAKTVKDIQFLTASPAVSNEYHWAKIENQIHPMEISSLQLRWHEEQALIEGKTENVLRLAILTDRLELRKPITISLDGDKVEKIPAPENKNPIYLMKVDGHWKVSESPKEGEVTSRCSGPFKNAFRRHMVFVYGTKGNELEKSWALQKARYDAEQFYYRGNGSIEIISDEKFLQHPSPDCNVILFGNADTNQAWNLLLKNSPLQVKAGEIKTPTKTLKGDDYSVCFVQLRSDSKKYLVGVVSGTGSHAMHRTDLFTYFTSGVAYPDWLIIDGKNTPTSEKSLVGLGYWNYRWQFDEGESSWRP